MASLKFLLGMIPSTSKIEQAEKTLNSEFEKLNVFADSEQLARYIKLDGLVNSSEFSEKCKALKSLNYKDSDEYSNEKEFLSLQKSKDIVHYFKTVSGSSLKRFREMDGSAKIKDYEELEKFIESPVFREKQKMRPITFKDTDEYRKLDEYKSLKKDPSVKSFLKKKTQDKTKTILRYEELAAFVSSKAFLDKQKMRPITFKDSDEYKKFLEYKRLKGTTEIKEFYKFKNSKEYSNFLNIDGSTKLKRLEELKAYVASPEFKQRKEYLTDKKRFEKSELFKDQQDYKKLKKDHDILWYYKVKDSAKFDICRSRKLTFCDEFEGNKLDTNKWLTNFYWGEKLLGDRYSVESDLHSYTEKDNFEVSNSVLRISTKPKKVTGKIWSAAHGFKTKEFDFTSGIINTGNSFRQKYGIFSAKIKLGNPAARNTFWMLADKVTPHLDICRTSDGKVWFDYVSPKGTISKASLGSKYSGDYFIYTLEWTPDKLVWKINNNEVFVQTSEVPQEPMYVLLAGGLNKPVNSPTSMEIDWVRVYTTN